MKSIRHVLWRGALAFGLMAVGFGSGLGMPPVEQAALPACPTEARAVIAGHVSGDLLRAQGATPVVLRGPLTPAG